MKAKLKGNLRELHAARAVQVRHNMVEFVQHYKHNDTFVVACYGVNSYGVQFKGTIRPDLKDNFYFQYDLNDTYDKVKDAPASVYNL